MISTLQVYRGFAAMIVVLFHAIGGMDDRWYNSGGIIEFFKFGHSGVEFFFVLSGFIIFYIHKVDIGKGKKYLKSYALKRVLRIFPIYWVLLFVLGLACFSYPSFGASYHHKILDFFLSIFLIPQDHPQYIAVAWTLSHEILFYCIFSFLIFHKEVGITIMLIWQGLIAYFIFVPQGTPFHYLQDFFFSTYNILFLFGMFAAWVNAKYREYFEKNFVIFILGNFIFLATGIIESYYNVSEKLTLLYGVGAFLIIVNSTNEQVNHFFKHKKLLLLIGNASFSLYLIHLYVIKVVSILFQKLHFQNYFSDFFLYCLMFLSSLLCGLFMYRFFEVPLLSKIRVFFNKDING